jgi:hypothetical protein
MWRRVPSLPLMPWNDAGTVDSFEQRRVDKRDYSCQTRPALLVFGVVHPGRAGQGRARSGQVSGHCRLVFPVKSKVESVDPLDLHTVVSLIKRVGGGLHLLLPLLLERPQPVGRTPSTAICSGLPVQRGPAILSRMGTKSRETIYGASVRAAAERATEARKGSRPARV